MKLNLETAKTLLGGIIEIAPGGVNGPTLILYVWDIEINQFNTRLNCKKIDYDTLLNDTIQLDLKEFPIYRCFTPTS